MKYNFRRRFIIEKIDLVREIRELKNQLSYSKNIGFFFGAGTSCALGIPNIAQLTVEIEDLLVGKLKDDFKIIKDNLIIIIAPKVVTIEDILNNVRQIREITGERSDKNYLGVDGNSAKLLDIEICKKIFKIIMTKEEVANIEITKKFFAWLSFQNRDYSKEIFTTNYDLIIEKSLEGTQIPYFDGFVGSYEPFFLQESIYKFVEKTDLTENWIRLWKIHGSLGWFWKNDATTNTNRVVRIGKISDCDIGKSELVIYPSKEKYNLSRKQPFIAYFDRLKNYLLNGELLFVFTGYSFADQHINEIIFNCLRQNNRLSVLVFFYQDSEVENLYPLCSNYLNINVFGPKKAIMNGALGDWEFKKDEMKASEKSDNFWDETKKEFLLGDFNKLVNFLVTNSGKKQAIEEVANGK